MTDFVFNKFHPDEGVSLKTLHKTFFKNGPSSLPDGNTWTVDDGESPTHAVYHLRNQDDFSYTVFGSSVPMVGFEVVDTYTEISTGGWGTIDISALFSQPAGTIIQNNMSLTHNPNEFSATVLGIVESTDGAALGGDLVNMDTNTGIYLGNSDADIFGTYDLGIAIWSGSGDTVIDDTRFYVQGSTGNTYWQRDNNGEVGVLWETFHNSASPAGEDDILWRHNIKGNNSNGVETTFVSMFSVNDPTAGSEFGALIYQLLNNSMSSDPFFYFLTPGEGWAHEWEARTGDVSDFGTMITANWPAKAEDADDIDATNGSALRITSNVSFAAEGSGDITSSAVGSTYLSSFESSVNTGSQATAAYTAHLFNVDDSGWGGGGAKIHTDWQYNDTSFATMGVDGAFSLGTATVAGGTFSIYGDASGNLSFEIDAANNSDITIGSASLGTQPEVFTFGNVTLDKAAGDSPKITFIDESDKQTEMYHDDSAAGFRFETTDSYFHFNKNIWINDDDDIPSPFYYQGSSTNWFSMVKTTSAMVMLSNTGPVDIGANNDGTNYVRITTDTSRPVVEGAGANDLMIKSGSGTVLIPDNVTLSGTSGHTLLIETTDASDPMFTFKTTNTAHQINILLDESTANDVLNIAGQTASVNTVVDVTAQDGEDAILRLFSGTNNAQFKYNSSDNLVIENETEDKDIIFKINDGGVDKQITWDASTDKLKHDQGTFDFDDDNLTTTGNIDTNSGGAITSNGTLTAENDCVVAGEMQGARLLISGGKTAPYTATTWLKMINGANFSTTNGYCMSRAGSVVGISCSVQCSVVTTGGTVDCELRKNGAVVLAVQETINATGDWNFYATQARGTDTFNAGDVLTFSMTFGTFVGTLHDTCTLAELQFDT